MIALWATVFEQSIEELLNVQISEHDTIFLLVQSRSKLTVKIGEQSNCFRENDLKADSNLDYSYQTCNGAHFITYRDSLGTFTNLRQVLTADRTLVLKAQAAHTCRAFIANGMITRPTKEIRKCVKKSCDEEEKSDFLPNRVYETRLEADNAGVLVNQLLGCRCLIFRGHYYSL